MKEHRFYHIDLNGNIEEIDTVNFRYGIKGSRLSTVYEDLTGKFTRVWEHKNGEQYIHITYSHNDYQER